MHSENLTSVYCAKLFFVLVSLSTKEIQEKVNKLGIMDTLLQDPCKVRNDIIMPNRFMVASCQICLFIVMVGHDTQFLDVDKDSVSRVLACLSLGSRTNAGECVRHY